MGAGQLDQHIAIETPTITTDELGQEVPTWAVQARPWAKVKETPGREFLSGDFRAEERVVFVIYWRSVDSTARVAWNGRTYRIEGVTGTRRERFAYLHCVAQDGAN